MLATYAFYLGISLALTIWVGWTLHRNGRLFLIEAFHGNHAMADSVNHLLVVGFYLINIGFVALFLRFFDRPQTVDDSVEYVSTKVGIVLVVLGIMHFYNMFNFAKMRSKGRRSAAEAEERALRLAALEEKRGKPQTAPDKDAAPPHRDGAWF